MKPKFNIGDYVATGFKPEEYVGVSNSAPVKVWKVRAVMPTFPDVGYEYFLDADDGELRITQEKYLVSNN